MSTIATVLAGLIEARGTSHRALGRRCAEIENPHPSKLEDRADAWRGYIIKWTIDKEDPLALREEPTMPMLRILAEALGVDVSVFPARRGRARVRAMEPRLEQAERQTELLSGRLGALAERFETLSDQHAAAMREIQSLREQLGSAEERLDRLGG